LIVAASTKKFIMMIVTVIGGLVMEDTVLEKGMPV
jgi:hypothetical protein